MKHLNAEKYSLAWFKLAECVSRGEKERALGVYRLLSHSIGDDALACQLYGDLFLCFKDKDSAVERYTQAAHSYKKQNKIIEAIAVYEHLVTLESEKDRHMLELCDLYLEINLSFKVLEHIELLAKSCRHELAQEITQKLEGA
ncbi:hypothetical protein ACFLYU_02675 [Candidatus Dependentiae bacterium]